MTDSPFAQNLVLRAALAARPSPDGRKWKIVNFEGGRQFWKEHDTLTQVIFPLHGVLSVQILADSAKQVDIAMVGREGFAGVSVFLGEPKARSSVMSLTAGQAVLMPRKDFEAYLRNAAFRDSAVRYVRSLMHMLARFSVCNRAHLIENVCVGRLLLMQDRTRADSFQVTQDSLSRMLGVRRATVSRAASQLLKEGAIHYDRRGRLTILDRARLEKFACPCYRAMKADFDRFVRSQGGL